MLVEFRFKNFKPFRDEQVFSLIASSDKSLPENTIELPGQKFRLLKSAVVYGPNGAGKTALLDALNFFVGFTRRSARMEPDKPIGVTPFLFDERSRKKPSSFEAIFIHDGVRYQYGFTVNREMVLEEWLFSYPKGRARRLFRRFLEEGEIRLKIGPHLKNKRFLSSLNLPHNALFLSTGASVLNHSQLKKVHEWFTGQITGLKAPGVGPFPWLKMSPQERERLSSTVARLLRMADIPIERFEFLERDLDERTMQMIQYLLSAIRSDEHELPKKQLDVRMFHRRSDVPLALQDESRGTQQLLSLGYFLLPVLSQGQVAFVDELDASLHPHLARELVKLFHNPVTNLKNAQLIFNTHDVTLLSGSLFRRDQIWLVEKDREEAAHLYSLLEYSPRKSESLERGYLMGRYGAIPFLVEPTEGLVPGD